MVDLTNDQLEQYKKIKGKVKVLKNLFQEKDSYNEIINIRAENAQLCYELHKSLKQSGHPPVHCKYIIENRGILNLESVEFYLHYHTQEDLVKFVEDPSVNIKNDKLDVTMGEKFDFKVYSVRWGHYDCYIVKKTSEGWYISFMGIGGHCDVEGSPYLYKNFIQDGISYPVTIKFYFSSIWREADLHGSTVCEVQEMFNRVAEWLKLCEEKAPSGILN